MSILLWQGNLCRHPHDNKVISAKQIVGKVDNMLKQMVKQVESVHIDSNEMYLLKSGRGEGV